MYAAWIVVEMNLSDWVLVFLSTGIIFAILGRRLLADVAEWRQGRASARAVDGSPAPGAEDPSTAE